MINNSNSSDPSAAYVRLSTDDFASGRKINFSVYMRLTADRFVKVAHKGEDLSKERVQTYKKKGLDFLYIRQEDFIDYVGFDLDLAERKKVMADPANRSQKAALMSQCSEILRNQIRHEGLDPAVYETASAFAEASLNILAEDRAASDLLLALQKHSDHVFAHSMGVSVYSVMISQHIKWKLPTNKFKLAVGGALHDIGEKEIGQHILSRPKYDWSDEDWKDYESHVQTGRDMLDEIKSIPEDAKEIVRQHHENCAAKGFPQQLKKSAIHPMARLVAVADEFCYKILKTPDSNGISPKSALQDLQTKYSDLLDKEFLSALGEIFKVPQI